MDARIKSAHDAEIAAVFVSRETTAEPNNEH
jgi:hypothetical protein